MPGPTVDDLVMQTFRFEGVETVWFTPDARSVHWQALLPALPPPVTSPDTATVAGVCRRLRHETGLVPRVLRGAGFAAPRTTLGVLRRRVGWPWRTHWADSGPAVDDRFLSDSARGRYEIRFAAGRLGRSDVTPLITVSCERPGFYAIGPQRVDWGVPRAAHSGIHSGTELVVLRLQVDDHLAVTYGDRPSPERLPGRRFQVVVHESSQARQVVEWSIECLGGESPIDTDSRAYASVTPTGRDRGWSAQLPAKRRTARTPQWGSSVTF